MSIEPSMLGDFEVLERYQGGEGWSGKVRRRKGDASAMILKVLEPGMEVREGSLLASLEHPRIPRLLDTGCTEGNRSFLLREFLPGRPIDSFFPLSPAEANTLAVQLLEILAYVHLRSVLHLDLKPANILRNDAEEPIAYCLLDFGLGSRGRGAGSGGTPFFAPPEVLLGLTPDPRSDLFSLGAVLWLALRTSKSPLPLGRFRQLFPQEGFFAAIGSHAGELPPPFDTFLPRLLARRPGERLADAQEALEALTGGSGRPSLSLLDPDPITTIGSLLEPRLEALEPGSSVELSGGDARDREALALHHACSLPGVSKLERHAESCLIRRGEAVQSLALPELSPESLAAHLESAAGLDSESAASTARELIARGISSPARVGRTLRELTEAGRLLPDGSHWIWPDAISGRWQLEDHAAPENAKLLAARGRPEQALAAHRRALAASDPSLEPALRQELAEGFLLGGEPARALPFVHDLPLLRARALLDLGRVGEASAELGRIDPAGYEGTLPDLERMRAYIAYSMGRLEEAERIARPLIDQEAGEEAMVTHGLVLAQLGRPDQAASILTEALSRLDEQRRPYLRAAALTNLAEVDRHRNRLEEARGSHVEAMRLYQSLGNVRYTATASSNLGVIAKDLGEFEEALIHQRRARSLFAHLADEKGVAVAEANLGILNLESGDPRSAVKRLESAYAELERLEAREPLPLVSVMLARGHALLGDTAEALKWLGGAEPLTTIRLQEEAEKVRKLLRAARTDATEARADMIQGEPTPARGVIDATVPKAVFRTFLAVNRRLASDADLDSAMSSLLEAAVTLTGGRLGYFLVVRPNGVRQEFRTDTGTEAGISFSRSLVNRSIQRGQTLTEQDAIADEDLMSMPSVRGLRVRSAICAPFVCASGTRGALYVEHPGRSGVFGDAEKEQLEVLSDQASIAVERMLHEEQLAEELAHSRRDLQIARRELGRGKQVRMLGKSRRMARMQREIEKVARSDLAILVLGETGTGKELVARSIHEQSERCRGPFVTENCSAVPEELIESEFFGHMRGAFTGADSDRPGLLELATGGTMFLDEIGDMPQALQSKLLRALQERRIRRVGGKHEIPIDVRIIAATHKDIRAMLSEGKFREDLYYRIGAVEIRVPPLRERDRDCVLLAESFLERHNEKHGRTVRLSAGARRQIENYSWPGNVRELEHVIARAFLLSDSDELDQLHLPEEPDAPSPEGAQPVMTLREAEERAIRAALATTGGAREKTAKLLGISRTALYEKLKRMKG